MKKYKFIDSKKICLFASEIAIITGDNKFKNLGEIIFRIWKLNFNKDFLKYEDIFKNNKNNFLNTNEKMDKFIDKYNIDKNIKKQLDVNNINNLNLEKNNILQKCSIIDDKDRIEFTNILNEYSNTNFGKINENKSLHIYTQLTNEPVIKYDKFTKQIIFNYNDYQWFIGGKIDGILKDKSIIEVKNRMHKLFRVLKEYEKIQIYSYMFLFNSKKAYLVETYLKNIQPETNIIDIHFDINYWNSVLVKIEKFINIFYKFFNSEELKLKLLNDGPNNFKL